MTEGVQGGSSSGGELATKGAIKNLTRGMCADWAPLGLQVNAIGPGYFATALNRPLWDDPRRQIPRSPLAPAQEGRS